MTWAIMLPSFPEAAEIPWHVARYWVGKTSAGIWKCVSERLKRMLPCVEELSSYYESACVGT